MIAIEWLKRQLRSVSGTSTATPFVDPVLAHIHVPKCGGTAFHKFLSVSYGPAHRALYVADTFFVYPEAELTGYLADRSVRGFSSHFVRTFPRRLAGRDRLYVTFLRDPVDQFISYITCVKKNYERIQDDKNLIASPPSNLPDLSVRDIARWILTCDHEVNFRETLPSISSPCIQYLATQDHFEWTCNILGSVLARRRIYSVDSFL